MILDRIRDKMSTLTDSQKRVAQYILSDPEAAASLTAAKLAEASQVSEATVIRFANYMGFIRYSMLRKELKMLLQGTMSQMERLSRGNKQNCQSNMMQQVTHSMRTDIRSIEKTLAGLKEEDLARAVEWLTTARRVYVAGSHSEYGIACYFASTLGWIRDNVCLLDQTHLPTFDSPAQADESDLIVAMSFPPYPAATVRYLQAVRARGGKAIAITDSPLSPLARQADCSFYACDEKLSFADNSAPTVSLLSALLALVSNENPVESSAKLAEKQKYWEELDFYFKDPTS